MQTHHLIYKPTSPRELEDKNMKIKILKQNNGFTLVEALVAISILMIAIASPMTLAQKGLSTATQSKDQMIAAFLAQDAIEAVKNIRDQIALRGTDSDWLNSTVLDRCVCKQLSLSETCDFNYAGPVKSCKIDTTATVWNNSSIEIAGVSAPVLSALYNINLEQKKTFLRYYYEPVAPPFLFPLCSGFSGVGNCREDTKFKRLINIIKTSEVVSGGDVNEAVVNVRVKWTNAQGEQILDVKDFIYNYSENL